MHARPIACSTLPFTDRPLADVLGNIADAGFSQWELPIRGDGVHLGHVDPAPLLEDAGYRGQILRSCRTLNAPQLLSAGFEIDRRSPLSRELEQFRACADLIAELGGRFITVFAFDDGAAPRRERIDALATAASELGLSLLVETHRRTATQDPRAALELAQTGQPLTFDHSHYVSQGLAASAFAPLRPFAQLLQVRGCGEGKVEAPVEAEEQQEEARRWWMWIQEEVPREVPVVIEYIDRQRDWWPSISWWKNVLRG